MADGSTTAAGPAYFRVWTKGGKVIDYGNSPNTDANSQATITAAYPVDATTHYAKAWMISHVADVFGNTIDYRYNQRTANWGSNGASQGGREWTLSEIDYSGNKVLFEYTDRASGPIQDGSESYATTDKMVVLRLLASITTYVNAPYNGTLGAPAGAVPVTTTQFAYTASTATQRSLLTSIKTCAGGPASTTCSPAEIFGYTNGGSDLSYTHAAPFNLATSPLYTYPLAPPERGWWPGFGGLGLLTGDFNGDGRTDLIRWSSTDPSQNQLLASNGDGSFTDKSTTFNIKDQLLFRHDGCVQTTAQDFDNDGLVDLFVYSSPTSWQNGNSLHPGYISCESPLPPAASAIYHNNGDGTFKRQAISITGLDGKAVGLDLTTFDTIEYTYDTTTGEQSYYWGEGHVFYLLDLDGDGVLDLVISMRQARPYGLRNTVTTPLCAPGATCTRVFKGDGHGNFVEKSTNVAGVSLYSPGTPRLSLTHSVVDLNGDGYPDILVNNSTLGSGGSLSLVSRGDFNFDIVDTTLQYPNQVAPSMDTFIDYNGDGRNDVMSNYNSLLVLDKTSNVFSYDSTFNLTHRELGALDAPEPNVAVDLNGDGKQDFMRVKFSIPGYNIGNSDSAAAYLSNGDGTFTASSTYNIDTVMTSDGFGANAWVLGDFTGHGQPEVLALTPSKNGLYVRTNQAPTDLLKRVTDSSGAVTTFTYVPMANPYVAGDSSPRYVTDRLTSNAATGTKADVNAGGFVVGRMTTDNGVGGSLQTDYWYAGLKRDLLGRGSLGFREVRRQHVAPDGSALTDQTVFAQDFPYTGQPLQANVYHAAEGSISSANQLKATTTVYCDQTAASGADATAIANGVSCTSTAVSKRPYTLWSQTKAWDLAGASLATQTHQSAINADGAPTVTTETATMPGSSNVFTQTTTNTYPATDDTSCAAIDTCHWILARVQRTTVASSVPSTIPTTSAGTATNATDTQGHGTLQAGAVTKSLAFGNVTVGAQPTANATLSNTSAVPLAVTAPGSASVTGTGFSFVSTTCPASLASGANCTITVNIAPTNIVSYTGTLTVSTGAGALTTSLSGTGTIPSVTLTPVSANWGTIGAASDSGDWPTIVNHSTVPILIVQHSVVNGPSGVWAYQGDSTHCQPGSTVLQPNASCQTFFGIGNLATVGSYSATENIGYQAVGVTQTSFHLAQTYSFSVATTTASSSSLSFANTIANTTSAGQTFTVVNNASGSPVNIGISMVGSQPSNFPMSSTCGSSLANGASCTVTVSFNPTAIASYSAAVQVSYSYPRMQGGQNSSYYPSSASFSVPVSGTGISPTPVPFTSGSPTTAIVTGGRTGTWTFTNPNSFAVKPTAIGVTVTPSYMAMDVSIGGTCGSAAVAAGGTCTVTLTTVADCTAYTATPTVTDGGGTTTGTGSLSQPKTTNTKSCT